MEWLNYHHLLYFWMVAKEGSITEASKQLRLAHPTISGQIHRLEEVLGEKLFTRKGRGLALTEVGQTVFRYAEEIFSLGGELVDSVKGRGQGRQARLVVGVSDVLPKSIVHRILEPVFHLDHPVRLICRENRSASAFLAELAAHTVDVILSDAPAGPGSSVKAFSHPLGECGTTFFATPSLAKKCRAGFPKSLNQVPIILPSSDSTFRRALDEWFDAQGIRPQVAAELDDAALVSVFAADGLGLFAAPSAIEREARQQYRVEVVGRARSIRQRFYAISVERKFKEPAINAICEGAKKRIFGRG